MIRAGIIILSIILYSNSMFAQGRLTLDDCINIALANNTQVLNAEYNLNTSKAQKLASYNNVLPTISLSASPNRFYRAPSTFEDLVPVGIDPRSEKVIYEKKERISPNNTVVNYRFGFNVSQNLWDQGRMWQRIQQAESGFQASAMNFEKTKLNTIADVKSKYYELAKVLAQREVLEESVRLAEEQLNQSEIMFEIGTVAQIDIFRSKVSFDQTRIALIDQDLVIVQAYDNLNLAMGRDINAPIEIETNIPLEVTFPIELEQLVGLALQSSPDIRQQEKLLTSAELGVKIAKANRYPTLSYNVSYSRSNSDLDRLYNNLSRNYTFSTGLNLSYNLFDGFQTRSTIKQAENTRMINEENLELGKRNIESTVNNYYQRLLAYKDKIEINKEMVVAAEEDLRLANERYRVGLGTLLETITAQRDLTSARYSLLQMQYDTLTADSYLQAAIGKY